MAKEVKDKLIIIDRFVEISMDGAGEQYIYRLNNKVGTTGSFNINLLNKYEEIYDIDWKRWYHIHEEVKG